MRYANLSNSAHRHALTAVMLSPSPFAAALHCLRVREAQARLAKFCEPMHVKGMWPRRALEQKQ